MNRVQLTLGTYMYIVSSVKRTQLPVVLVLPLSMWRVDIALVLLLYVYVLKTGKNKFID